MQGLSCQFEKSVSSQTSRVGHSLGPPALLLLEGGQRAPPPSVVAALTLHGREQ